MISYFPKRLFWKVFISLVFFLNFLFITSLGIASYIFDFSFYTTKPLIFILCFFALSVVGAAIFSYRFVEPLKRVILKALRIASKKYVNEFEEDDVLFDEPGEYHELEIALDKIRRKLKKRRLQLSHEREESQALMSSMDDAIVSVGYDQRLIYYNSQFATQFVSQELMQSKNGTNQLELTDCLRDPEVLKIFSLALNQGVSQNIQIKLNTQLDKQVKYFSIRISPLKEEESRKVYGALALFHDITELKKAEQIRIEFVENASHELRTPLTAVKGFVETLKEDLYSGRMDHAPQFLNIISKNVDRLTELVNDMLTISSLESNSLLRSEFVHLPTVTEEVITQLSNMALEKKILIKTYYEINELKADPVKLEQVLANLISNAIKYIPSGGIVEIKWELDGQQIRLTVKDNGPGIPEEHLGRLFERFYRIDKGRSRDVGGSGLGLSIVKHILQSHGGQVKVKSELGRGSEFICLFPKNL